MNSALSEHQVALPPFRPECRTSGVLMHVTSLPSPYGIGDLGPAAFEWVDRLHDAGQRWWQALPLGPTGCGNSPYSCLSSFAGNALLVSPDLLIEDGLLSPTDCEAGRRLPKSAVDFDAVIAFKHRLLDQAWRNFDSSARPELRADFERFCSEEAHWLDDYALFRALKARLGGANRPRLAGRLAQAQSFGHGARAPRPGRPRSTKAGLGSSCCPARGTD